MSGYVMSTFLLLRSTLLVTVHQHRLRGIPLLEIVQMGKNLSVRRLFDKIFCSYNHL